MRLVVHPLSLSLLRLLEQLSFSASMRSLSLTNGGKYVLIFQISRFSSRVSSRKQRSVSAGAQGQGSDPNVFLARLLAYQETPQYVSFCRWCNTSVELVTKATVGQIIIYTCVWCTDI